MAIKPISWLGLNLGPKVGEGDVIVGVRVVPVKREGRTIYGRTLNFGEPDSGESITVNPGDTLIFRPGFINVSITDVDRYSDWGPDGYAPVANTIWSWLIIPPVTQPREKYHYLIAAARRLDMAHVHCIGALDGLKVSSGQPSFLKQRVGMFKALGHAESMSIALNRAFRMIQNAKTKVAVPTEVNAVADRAQIIRNAFEHIDERAAGKARQEGPADAMTVFDQSDFFQSGILRYADHSLDIAAEVVPAMIAARKFIVDVVVHEGSTKTTSVEIKWTFTQDPEPTPMVHLNAAE